MSKSDTLEAGWLDLLFLNTDFTGVGDAGGLRGSVTAGSLFVSMHTDDPGEAGTQLTNEAAYTNYARVAVARTAGGWTRSTNNVSNTATVTFPQAGAGSPEDERFFGIGTASTGAGKLLFSGPLTGGATPLAFTAESSTDVLTVKNHSFVDDDEVFVFEVPGETLPTGLGRGRYFVITPTGDDFQVEATLGGGAVNFTTDGAGYIVKVVKKTIDPNDTPSFAAGELDVFED